MRLRHVSAAFVALVTAFAGCGGASDVDQPTDLPHQANANIDWRDQVIYQIMVDRFADGDTNNDINIAPTVPGRFHGGDWQGVIDHMDYLQTLGVTTLWISPVVKNVEDDAGFDGYHGYWTADFMRPNAHFGDLAKLRELVDAAHAKGMLVVLDIVANHVGQLFYYDINGNGQPDDTISGGGYEPPMHPDLRSAGDREPVLGRRDDVLRAGRELPRAHHRGRSRLRRSRHPRLDVARLPRPGDDLVAGLARSESQHHVAAAGLV